MNVDAINIYTKAHVTIANDKKGRIDIVRQELKVRQIRRKTVLEQDAVHKGCEADLEAHVLDVQGEGLLDTGAMVSEQSLSISTWTDVGFDWLDLIQTNIRLVAANQGAIYVTGRTPIL